MFMTNKSRIPVIPGVVLKINSQYFGLVLNYLYISFSLTSSKEWFVMPTYDPAK